MSEALRSSICRAGSSPSTDDERVALAAAERADVIYLADDAADATADTITLTSCQELTAEFAREISLVQVVPDPSTDAASIVAIQINEREDIDLTASGVVDVTAGANVFIGSDSI